MFPFWTLKNNVPKTFMDIYSGTHQHAFLGEIYIGVELLGLMYMTYSVLLDTDNVFIKVILPIYTDLRH